MKQNYHQLKNNCIIAISIAFLFISIGIETRELFETNKEYKISYEYINVKDMAQAHVATKVDTTNIIDVLFSNVSANGMLTEVELPSNAEEISLPLIENTPATQTEAKQIWYLPTEIGVVTQNPSYGHMALDITSPRTYQENIFPVANGVISGIYTDSAGAKIVTILHEIDGVKYTSQYAHLSSYATGLYVGKPVTINDSLGLMGSTGRSTGPHLHLAVLDCALFDPNDHNCSDLNGFFRYGKQRFNQGYIGLGTMMNVPGSWNSR